MENKKNGRIDIRGLDKKKIDLLKSIANEKGFTSLNDFMIYVVDLLVKNEITEIHKDLYRVQINELSEVQKAILAKIEGREKMSSDVLSRLENLEKLTVGWLGNQENDEEGSSS